MRELSFSGTLQTDMGGGVTIPAKRILVDVYRFWETEGNYQFERLNQVPQRTSITGDFSFTNLPVPVEVQMVIPGSPPYTPVEIIKPGSLPNLAFFISIEAEVAGSVPVVTQCVEIYDEKRVIKSTWIAAHPGRMHVALSGSSFSVLIPKIAGGTVPNNQFHFLRVGRVIRQEIGEVGDVRPEYVGKSGYMRSSNTWASPQPSFIPGVIDAPFGGTLHIGGWFGANLLNEEIYYTVSASGVQILDPLFNYRYILPTLALPSGKWEAINLGPFDATISGVPVQVYRKPPLPDFAVEYWPFYDLIVLWNSATAPNNLRILSLEAYRNVGTGTTLELVAIPMVAGVNSSLPLQIDNRPPVPKLLPFNSGDLAKFRTAYAQFSDDPMLPVPELVVGSIAMGIFNSIQISLSVVISFCQPSSSKSIARKWQVSFSSKG